MQQPVKHMSDNNTFPFPNQNKQSGGKDQSMEQIRELLFGRDLKQISDKLQSLENSINLLREELKKSHGHLETTIYNETTARNQAIGDLDHNLKTALSAVDNQLSDLASKINGEMDSMYSQLDSKFKGELQTSHSELDTRLSENIESLRTQSEQRFSNTESLINNRHSEISQSLETATQHLNQDKASKRTIAGLLESMAMAVREETE